MDGALDDDLRRIEANYERSRFVREACLIHGPAADVDGPPRHLVVVPDQESLRARRTVNVRDLLRFELETCGVCLPAPDRITGFDVSRGPLPRGVFGPERARVESRWREQALGRRQGSQNDEASAWPAADSCADAARSAISGQRPGIAISPDTNLDLDLRLDSLERVDLLLEAERLAGVTLEQGETWQIVTAGDLAEALRHSAPGSPTVPAGFDTWTALLGASPAAEARGHQIASPKPVRMALAFTVLKTAVFLLRGLIDLRVTGTNLLPRQAPFLLAPNHQTYVDGFLVCAALPFRLLRSIFVVGAPEYVATPLTAWAAEAYSVLAVDADANLVGAMQTAAAGLRRGKALLIFPEGERCLDGTLVSFRRGAAILATRLGVPVVPVAIDGAHEIWPRGRGLQWNRLRPFRRPVVRIRFGAPLRPGLDGVPSDDSALTTALRQAIGRLLEE